MDDEIPACVDAAIQFINAISYWNEDCLVYRDMSKEERHTMREARYNSFKILGAYLECHKDATFERSF